MSKDLIEFSHNDVVAIDFREVAVKVFKYRHIIIFSIFICVLCAMFYGFITCPVYKSTTRILVEGKPPKIVKVENFVVPDYTDRENYFNSQIEVLKSHAVASMVYDELGGYASWEQRGKKAVHKKAMARNESIDSMLKKVKITPVRMTNIIEISVEDLNPVLAAKIANCWIRSYVLFSSTDQLIQHRSELEQDLDQQYKYYKEKHPVIQGLKSQIAAVNDTIVNERRRIFETAPLDQASFTTNDANTSVKVLDEAQVPLNPERPKKLMNLIMSLFLGAFLGFGLMFLFELLDQSIKTPQDIGHLLRIPFLISIPLCLPNASKKKTTLELMTLTERHSPLGEAFRSLRTNILFSNPDIKKKILVVTSASPAEGKTTVAVNLATAFAQVDEKTLIIDADLRNPRLHYIFDAQRGNGITEALSLENVDLTGFMHQTHIPNLSIINAGALPPNPSELLGSKKMQELLKKLAETYDRIILDTPPILAATDAVVLGAKADGVIFVLRAGSTPTPAAIRSLNYLMSVHANIFGAVLNMVRPKEHGDYYHYYHDNQDDPRSKKR